MANSACLQGLKYYRDPYGNTNDMKWVDMEVEERCIKFRALDEANLVRARVFLFEQSETCSFWIRGLGNARPERKQVEHQLHQGHLLPCHSLAVWTLLNYPPSVWSDPNFTVYSVSSCICGFLETKWASLSATTTPAVHENYSKLRPLLWLLWQPTISKCLNTLQSPVPLKQI